MPCSPRPEGSSGPTTMPRACPASKKVSSAETVIIEVEDDDTPSPAFKRTHGRSLRSEHKLQDTDKLCEFPMGKSPNVTVTFQDYKTLEHDTFLNDIIIDFYLTYLHTNNLNKEDAPNVYIFSTMFYKRMLTQPSSKSLKPDSFEKNPSLTSAQKRHMRVRGWTKNVDLFTKDMIIIPICEHSHWYLVIVIKPGLVVNAPESEARRVKGEPFFIVLDSLGESKTTAVNNVRSYLELEWQAKKMVGEVDFSKRSMRTLWPVKPEQPNYSDCGIYLLHYVEKIFNSVAQFYWPDTVNRLNADWFPWDEVSMKRSSMAQLIRSLNEAQRSPQEPQVNWPAINFVDPGPPPRGRKKPPGFFDEYQPSSEEEEEDKEARKRIAEGFYGKSSRTTRSSTALPSSNKHNSGGSRAAGLVEMARTGAVDIEALEEEGLPERERARKARHAGRGMTKAKQESNGHPKKTHESRSKTSKVRERKLKQEDTNIEFDMLRLYQPPNKKMGEPDAAKEEVKTAEPEFNPSAERYFQTTVPVRQRVKGEREGTWSQELKEESRKEKMRTGAMDDLKHIEEAHSGNTTGGDQNRVKKPHKNKALEVFKEVEVRKKGEMSLQLLPKEKQADMRRSFQDQRQNRTFDANTRVQAILEESDILKDLEALAEDGSEVGEDDQRPQEPGVEGKQIVHQKEEGRQKTGSQKSSILMKNIGAEANISTAKPGQNAKEIEVTGKKGQEETKEESRPISLPSSPEVEESLREGLGEVLTLDDSPKPNNTPQRTSAEKCSPRDVVEIIEEDVEEEGAITGFLERVPKVSANASVSSVDSPIYPPPPPRQLFKKKHPPVKKLRIEDPSGVKKLCLRDTSSEESEEEEDSGIISCGLDAKNSVKVKFGKLAPSKPSQLMLPGRKKMKMEKKSGRL